MEQIKVASTQGNVATLARSQSFTDDGKLRKNADTFEGCAVCLNSVPKPGEQYGAFMYQADIPYCMYCGENRDLNADLTAIEKKEIKEDVVEEVVEAKTAKESEDKVTEESGVMDWLNSLKEMSNLSL